MSVSLSRRQLFRLGLGDLHRLANSPENEEKEPVYRPPGALNEDRFLVTCERCHACIDACPHGAIAELGPAFGRLEGTPYLRLETHPCHWCPSMPCIEACPSGALSRVESRPVAPVAKVTLHLDECLTSEGVLCDTCSVFCPDDVQAIRMVNRSPVLDRESCVGCGLCVYYCESDKQPLKIEHLAEAY